jgi:hypothetical protein
VSYDPGQWIGIGALLGTIIGWYLRRWWVSVPTCDHLWTDWEEISPDERCRYCRKCVKLEIEGKKEGE